MSDIDPFKMAKQHGILQGSIPVSVMSRARQLIASDVGEVGYTLDFSTDEDNLCVITGQLQMQYDVKCQRCLQVFAQQMSCKFIVSPVKNDQQAKVLPEAYGPVIVVDNKLDLAELIEDEFILAMPIVPKHQLGTKDCVEFDNFEVQQPNNPFQVLQGVKLKKQGQEAGDK